MDFPELSIITPVYNGERYIENCIKNVIEQNCPGAEHIIVDGCSADRTMEIVKQCAGKYPHIRYLSEKDGGQSDAMNKGINMARAKIISFLNVDDFYEPNVFNRVLAIFKTLPEPSLLVGNCNVWGLDGELEHVCKPKKMKLTDLLLGYNANPHPVNPSSYFYHKSLHAKIGMYDVSIQIAMDQDFIFKAVQAAHITYVDETWGNFRLLRGSKTVNDIDSGQIKNRDRLILARYRKTLSPPDKALFVCNFFLYQYKRILKYITYYLTHPFRP